MACVHVLIPASTGCIETKHWGLVSPRYCELIWEIIVILMSKIWTGSSLNFAHATTAQLSWYVQNYDVINSLDTKLLQNAFSEDLDYNFLNSSSNVSLVPRLLKRINCEACWILVHILLYLLNGDKRKNCMEHYIKCYKNLNICYK